jgi:LacI family transcriptional regulator
MAVTLKDIARKAGVGVSTVSYVLNRTGLNKVGEETQKKIQKIASDLNYRPSISARGLKQGKTFLIGGIFPKIKDSFIPDILQGIEDKLNDKSYSLVLCSYRNRKELNEKCALLCDKQVDGVIILPDFTYDCHTIYKQVLSKMPAVFVANYIEDIPIPYVMVDGEAVGYSGAKYLLEKGHSNIVFVIGGNNLKKVGIKRAFDEFSLKMKDAFIEFKHEKGFGKKVLHELCNLHPRPTGIFVNSDILAAEIINEAINMGIHVPEELSVLGTDGISICDLIRPGLSTVAQPKYEQGAKAGEIIMNMIDNKPCKSCLMQPFIEERASVSILKK